MPQNNPSIHRQPRGKGNYRSRDSYHRQFKNDSSVSNLDPDLAAIKAKHKQDLQTLQDMFHDWSEDDLLEAFIESNSDVSLTSSRIAEGHIDRFHQVGKKPTGKKPEQPTKTELPRPSSGSRPPRPSEQNESDKPKQSRSSRSSHEPSSANRAARSRQQPAPIDNWDDTPKADWTDTTSSLSSLTPTATAPVAMAAPAAAPVVSHKSAPVKTDRPTSSVVTSGKSWSAVASAGNAAALAAAAAATAAAAEAAAASVNASSSSMSASPSASIAEPPASAPTAMTAPLSSTSPATSIESINASEPIIETASISSLNETALSDTPNATSTIVVESFQDFATSSAPGRTLAAEFVQQTSFVPAAIIPAAATHGARPRPVRPPIARSNVGSISTPDTHSVPTAISPVASNSDVLIVASSARPTAVGRAVVAPGPVRKESELNAGVVMPSTAFDAHLEVSFGSLAFSSSEETDITSVSAHLPTPATATTTTSSSSSAATTAASRTDSHATQTSAPTKVTQSGSLGPNVSQVPIQASSSSPAVPSSAPLLQQPHQQHHHHHQQQQPQPAHVAASTLPTSAAPPTHSPHTMSHAASTSQHKLDTHTRAQAYGAEGTSMQPSYQPPFQPAFSNLAPALSSYGYENDGTVTRMPFYTEYKGQYGTQESGPSLSAAASQATPAAPPSASPPAQLPYPPVAFPTFYPAAGYYASPYYPPQQQNYGAAGSHMYATKYLNYGAPPTGASAVPPSPKNPAPVRANYNSYNASQYSSTQQPEYPEFGYAPTQPQQSRVNKNMINNVSPVGGNIDGAMAGYGKHQGYDRHMGQTYYNTGPQQQGQPPYYGQTSSRQYQSWQNQ